MHKVDVYLRVRRAVLEWGFRAGVARRLRDKGMPAMEIAEVLEVTRASVYRYLSETEGTNPDTGVAPPYPYLPGGAASEGVRVLGG